MTYCGQSTTSELHEEVSLLPLNIVGCELIYEQNYKLTARHIDWLDRLNLVFRSRWRSESGHGLFPLVRNEGVDAGF